MLTFIFGSSSFGGHEMMACKIINTIVREDKHQNVLILAKGKNIEAINNLTDGKCKIIEIQHKERRFEVPLSWLNPLVYLTLIEIFLKTKNSKEIILVNGSLSGNHSLTLATILACRFVRTKLTLYYPMLHSAKELNFKGFREKSYNRSINRILSNISHYIAIDNLWSERLKLLSKTTPNVQVIHNYVDVDVDVDELNRGEIKSSHLKIGIFGRLTRYQKGLDLFIEVAKILSERKSADIEFHIVGDGEYYESLYNSCVEIGNEKISFIFYGWQSEPMKIMINLDAFLLTSRTEGIPTVVIEAIQCGLPVFAFNIPGVNLLLSPNSLAESFDVINMANLIESYYLHPKRHAANTDYVKMLSCRKRFKSEVIASFVIN